MSEPGFRTQLWPAKGGNILVKHMDDQHLQNSINLMQKLHVGARRERSVLAARGKRITEHMIAEGIDHEEALQFVRDKMKTMKKWLKILKKERSYRKHRGISVPKGSTIIMPTGMQRMEVRKVCDNKAFDPDDPNNL